MNPRHPFRRLLLRTVLSLLVIPWPLFGVPSAVASDDAMTTAAQPFTDIIIEEIAWAGSSLSQADEWVELANLGSATATIGGWSLRGVAAQAVFLPEEAEIPPHGTYRVANYAETDEKSALAVTVQIATTTISLSNSALGIELVNASGTVRDLAGTGGTPPAGSSLPKATMVRVATSSTDLVGIWGTATATMGFKDGIADFGEPGLCRLCAQGGMNDPDDEDLTPSDAYDEMESEEPTDDTDEDDPIDVSVEDLSEDGDLHDLTTATSTEDVAPTATSTTSVTETTTPTSTPPLVETTSSATTTSTPPPAMTVTPRPPLQIRLNEAMSNPATGPEWIELTIDDVMATSTDRALELWDAAGRMITIPAGTAVSSPGYVVVTLPSARLNNGGDELSVRELNGIGVDLTTLPALKDGIAWARKDDGTWAQTDLATPGGANRFPAVPDDPPSASVQTPSTIVPPSSSVLGATTTTGTSASETRNPVRITLNEVLPAPGSGKEWVELKLDDPAAAGTDRALELWDASGKIATIAAGTPVTNPGYLVVALSSARLNNGGDEVHLLDANGIELDQTITPSLKQNIAWARASDGSWTDTDILSPGAENVFPASLPDSAIPADADLTPASLLLTGSGSAGSQTNMSTQDSARVRLVGTVGSVPRLFGATHAFVLLGEDGRGVITYLPKHLNEPPFGSLIRAMGTLGATDRGLELRMKTTDVWVTLAASSTAPEPREADLLAPAAEDAWSLVAAEGIVRDVNTRSFHLETEGVDIVVSVPAAVGYRTARLVKGDTVRVTGVLDLRKDEPAILIRTPEDIALLTHAEASVKTPLSGSASGHSFPDWVPFGAAAGAVLATGGVKRLHAFWKRRRLETLAAHAEGVTP